jgi:hypothetical protein
MSLVDYLLIAAIVLVVVFFIHRATKSATPPPFNPPRPTLRAQTTSYIETVGGILANMDFVGGDAHVATSHWHAHVGMTDVSLTVRIAIPVDVTSPVTYSNMRISANNIFLQALLNNDENNMQVINIPTNTSIADPYDVSDVNAAFKTSMFSGTIGASSMISLRILQATPIIVTATSKSNPALSADVEVLFDGTDTNPIYFYFQ